MDFKKNPVRNKDWNQLKSDGTRYEKKKFVPVC